MTPLTDQADADLSANRSAPFVLIVDDDAVSAGLIEHTLRSSGIATGMASDVRTALASIGHRRPDAVLLDIDLPDGRGFDVCRRLQTDPVTANTPVLFISGFEDVDTKVRAFETGGVDYITKPVSPAEVRARVLTHLRLRRAYKQLAELQAERIRRLDLAQQSFMPTPASVPGVRFHVARRQVLQAGGDFYDVLPFGADVVDFVVADASGHDLAASYWTAALKTLLAEYAAPANEPLHTLQQVNNALHRFLPSGVFFTLLYARHYRRSRKLIVANAGHPPAIVVPARSDARAVGAGGDVLGAFPDAVFGTTRESLGPGDRLVLFTDGLIDGAAPFDGEVDHLRAVAQAHRDAPLPELVEGVLTGALRGRTSSDDIVVLGADL